MNFNTIIAGAYLPGSQYDALNGDDVVTLPFDEAAAYQAGYEIGTPFSTGHGDNKIIGGDLDDTIIVGDGSNRLYGGEGNNTLDYSETSILNPEDYEHFDLVVNLNGGVALKFLDGPTVVDHFTNFDHVIGSIADDTLLGNANTNVLTGGAGNDKLYGKHGDDVLIGGPGEDFLDGGHGDDVLHFDIFDEHVDGGKHYDIASLTDSGLHVDLEELDLSNIEKLFFEGTDNSVEIDPKDVAEATDKDNILEINGVLGGDNFLQLNEIDGWTNSEPGVYEATIEHDQVVLNVNEANVEVVFI